MKTKLKEITDSTVNELLGNEIILPSNYLQCFDKHAKLIDINLEDEEFEKEINKLLLDEFNQINEYVNDATKTIDQAAEITQNAQIAIENKDHLALKELYKEITTLQNELQTMTDNVYKDYLTKAYNKKWLYHKYLSKDATFKEDALIILIKVKDYEYIAETYNKLIADNILIFITKFIKKKFKEEGIEFKISRYLTNKFIMTLEPNDTTTIDTFMSNVASLLSSTTLKSNSGIMLKPSYEFSVQEVQKDKPFHESLNALLVNVGTL